MTAWLRPLLSLGGHPPARALRLHGGAFWFDRMVDGQGNIAGLDAVPSELLDRLKGPLEAPNFLRNGPPSIMGILNVTPDSFSDGGDFLASDAAIKRGLQMLESGADILDIGGESTRPGAKTITVAEEIDRVIPVISGLRAAKPGAIISIDTRKARVAEAAITAGASLVNDVSAATFDPEMIPLVSQSDAALCLMHAQGLPETMQLNPSYGDVVGEVFDALQTAIERAIAGGISKTRLVVDPGLGFGKTGAHNLDLVRNLAVFHGLGVPVMFGASRKRFIGTITGAQQPKDRVVGSVTLALEAARQAVQVVRVHDIVETKQAFDMWKACAFSGQN